MGLMMSYGCPACGYATGELLLGPAPDPDRFDPRLVTCSSCRTLRVLDRAKAERGCRKHRRPYIVHHEELHVACPRCDQRMTATPLAIWD